MNGIQRETDLIWQSSRFRDRRGTSDTASDCKRNVDVENVTSYKPNGNFYMWDYIQRDAIVKGFLRSFLFFVPAYYNLLA